MGNYPHFKPTEELHKELNTIRSGQHVKYNVNYHIVWIPKYRKRLLSSPEIRNALTGMLNLESESRGWRVLALEIMPDHIHLFVSVPPSVAVASVVNQLKGVTSRRLRQQFPSLKQYVRKSLWAVGYYVSTAGFVSQAQVKKYIDAQWHAFHKKKKSPIPPAPKGAGILGWH